MMKHYKWILPIFILVSFFAAAQTPDSVADKNILISGWNEMNFSTHHFYENNFSGDRFHELEIFVNATDHSSTMNLPFSLSLIRNDFIDDEMKNDVSQKLNEMNVLEYGYSAKVCYRWLTDKFLYHSPSVYSISYQLGAYSNTHFTDQLFNTVFYGNAMFAGQTADFSNSKSYDFQYDRISFTAQKKILTSASTWEIGAGISLLGVHSLTKLELNNTSMFTEQNGEYIDLSYNFEYLGSDSSNHGQLQFDGAGASFDLEVSATSVSQKSRFTFYLNDFGFANWNKNTRTYTADSSIHFEGIEVADLFSSQSSGLIGFNMDSLFNLTGTSVQEGGRSTLLPFNMSFVYDHSMSQKIILSAGISYKPIGDLIPLFFVKPQWVINSQFQLAGVFSYGGTALYALGLDAYMKINDRLKLNIGSDNVLGIFIPKQTTSTSLFLRLRFLY